MTTKIILTRHGHVEGIEPRRFRGRHDTPLTSLGEQQSKATALSIAASWRPSIVYTSPMGRCTSTGTAIAEACKIPLEILPALNDIDYGAWQWKTHEEIAKTYPEDYATWRRTPHLFRFPQGDSLQELVARAADALRWVLQHHHDETVVLVGHNSVNRAFLTQILDQPLSAYWHMAFEPCGISEIDFDHGMPCVLRMNETLHLKRISA
ncbi:MAG: histidine phosphatase family protein [Rhodomicrobium sp.]